MKLFNLVPAALVLAHSHALSGMQEHGLAGRGTGLRAGFASTSGEKCSVSTDCTRAAAPCCSRNGLCGAGADFCGVPTLPQRPTVLHAHPRPAVIFAAVLGVLAAFAVLLGAVGCAMRSRRQTQLSAKDKEAQTLEDGLGQIECKVSERMEESRASLLRLDEHYFILKGDPHVSSSVEVAVRDGYSEFSPSPEFKFKLSKDVAALAREHHIVSRIHRHKPAAHVVQAKAYFEVTEPSAEVLRGLERSRAPAEGHGVGVLVMERGKNDLRDELADIFMARGRGEDVGDRVRDIVFQVAEALKAIHAEGLVWRDLKPENLVLFEACSLTCVWKAVDLDMAAAIGARLDDYLPSPEFAPPELAAFIARGTDRDASPTADPSYDMWGLGILLLEALAGCGVVREGGKAGWAQVASPKLASEIAAQTEALAGAYPEDARLIAELLNTDPTARPTAEAVLRLPHISARVSAAAAAKRARELELQAQLAELRVAVRDTDGGRWYMLTYGDELLNAVTGVNGGGALADELCRTLKTLREDEAKHSHLTHHSHHSLSSTMHMVEDEEGAMELKRTLRRVLEGLEGLAPEAGTLPRGPYRPQREILEGLDSMGDHDCPRFIYIAPKLPKHYTFAVARSAISSIVPPEEWEAMQWRLFLACPLCCSIKPTGSTGGGYKLLNPTETLTATAPLLRVVLNVLAVGCRGTPVALPVPSHGVSALQTSAALEIITHTLLGERARAIDAMVMGGVGVQGGERDAAKALAEKSWAAVAALLKDLDPYREYYGVSKVTCPATGQAEWVCADCTRGFMAHGYAYRGRWSKSADFEEDDGRAGLLE